MPSCCGGKCDSSSSSSGKTRYPKPLDPLVDNKRKWKEISGQLQHFSSSKRNDVSDDPYTYSGSNLVAVDFPIGGIGAGNVFLQGDGTLGQFTIVNQCREETEATAVRHAS